MRTKLEISNFRGVRSGTLEDLAPLTVLVGGNNSGKSTVLEALWFNASRADPAVAAKIATRRGWCGLDCLDQLLFDPKGAAAITSQLDGAPIETRLNFPAVWSAELGQLLKGDPRFDISRAKRQIDTSGQRRGSIFLNEEGVASEDWVVAHVPHDAHLFVAVQTLTEFGMLEEVYSAAAARGQEAALEGLLARIGLGGQHLRILKRGEQYVLHTLSNGHSVAVYFAGDGYKRLLYIACVLAGEAGGLVILEEPECFQHPRHVREMAQLIWGALALGTQVVLSTHSLDLLRHLFLAEGADLGKAALFHTSLQHGELRATRIPGERVRERLDDLGEDLRQ